MAIVVQCPSCGVSSQAADSFTGRTVRCKKCGKAFVAQPTLDGSRSDTKKSQPSAAGDPFPALPAEFGRYRVIRLLGKGGMGAVYLAKDSQLGREVALKIPFFDAKESPQRAERFVREARSAAALHHPNICTVFDAGRIAGTPFLTMAFIKGTPLDHVIDPDSPMSQVRAAEITRKLALALSHAHETGVVHRDLKPANVILAGEEDPIVMDFGLAKRGTTVDPNEAKLTRDGGVLGTPSYMSPEQVRGDAADIGPTTDIYSLGVILFEMLTGHTPYSGGMGAVMGKILAAPVPPLAETRPDADPLLNAICQKAMAKSPADRFLSMSAFALALSNYLKGTEPKSISVELVETPTRHPPDAMVYVPTAATASQVATKKSLSQSNAPVEDFDELTDSSTRKKRATKKQASNPWIGRGIAIAIALGILGPLVWFGVTLLRVETPNGTLIVEISDDEAETKIKGGKLVISGADGKERYTLSPSERNKKIDAGEYKIRVEGADGLVLDTPEFTLKKGDKVTVRVRAEVKMTKAEPSGQSIDFLKVLKLKEDVVSGRWNLDNGKLIGGGVELVNPVQERIQVNYSLPVEYDLELEVERITTANGHALTMIVDSHIQFQILLDCQAKDGPVHGLSRVDDKLGLNNETTIAGKEFENGKLVRVLCKVRMNAITISLNGVERIHWTGDQRRLSIHHPFWSLRDAYSVGLGIQLGQYRIHSWAVTVPPTMQAIPKVEIVDHPNSMSDEVDRKAAEYALSIQGCEICANNNHTFEGHIKKTSELPQNRFRLTGLFLFKCFVDDDNLKPFRKCKNLTELHLGRTSITNAGLENFKESESLRALDLFEMNISDDAIRNFLNSKGLTYIVATRTQIGDGGLALLKGFDRLTLLSLQGTRITDAGLVHLYGSQQLVQLDIRDTKVTKNSVDEL